MCMRWFRTCALAHPSHFDIYYASASHRIHRLMAFVMCVSLSISSRHQLLFRIRHSAFAGWKTFVWRQHRFFTRQKKKNLIAKLMNYDDYYGIALHCVYRCTNEWEIGLFNSMPFSYSLLHRFGVPPTIKSNWIVRNIAIWRIMNAHDDDACAHIQRNKDKRRVAGSETSQPRMHIIAICVIVWHTILPQINSNSNTIFFSLLFENVDR